MASNQHPDEPGENAFGRPEAFDEPDESIVESGGQFAAENAARKRSRMMVIALMALVLLIGAMSVGVYSFNRWRQNLSAERAAKMKADAEKAAATRAGKRLDMTRPGGLVIPEPAPAVAATPEPVKPIPLATAPLPASAAAPPPPPPPPMMDTTTTDKAADAAAAATATAMIGEAGAEPGTIQAIANAEAGGRASTSTAQVTAAKLGDRAYLLARGSYIPCILETQLNSNVPGNTSCVIPEDVFSDDGKILLVEKGSKAQGSYANTLKTGDSRIGVAWSRIKTTRGIVMDVDSPATDGVGTAGLAGYVDNHWVDRIGAAVLLSLVQDGIAYASTRQSRDNNQPAPGTTTTTTTATGQTVTFTPTNSSATTSRLAEKILDSTINIPPTLYKNRGDRVMIFVNRDLWFDAAYKLVAE